MFLVLLSIVCPLGPSEIVLPLPRSSSHSIFFIIPYYLLATIFYVVILPLGCFLFYIIFIWKVLKQCDVSELSYAVPIGFAAMNYAAFVITIDGWIAEVIFGIVAFIFGVAIVQIKARKGLPATVGAWVGTHAGIVIWFFYLRLCEIGLGYKQHPYIFEMGNLQNLFG